MRLLPGILPKIKYFKSLEKRNATFQPLLPLAEILRRINNSSGRVVMVERKSSAAWKFSDFITYQLFDLGKFI